MYFKMDRNNELRIKSNGTGGANTLKRVSVDFSKKLDAINDRREENGFDRLSNPKMTELIIKHKSAWQIIEKDLIYFNMALEPEEEMIHV